MIKKLRVKFVIVNMTIVTIMLILLLGILYGSVSYSITRENENIMRTINISPRRPDRPIGEEPERPQDANIGLPFFTIQINNDGEITNTFGDYYDLSDDVQAELYKIASSSNEDMGEIKEYSFRYLRRETPDGGIQIMFEDMTAEELTLKAVLKTCIFTGVIAFGFFLIISIVLAYWTVKPVEESFNRQKQFISDASHELKTPLTVILTNTEMLSAPDYSEEQKKGFANNISVMAHQMRGLVENLLSLTRVDNGTATMNMEEIDFSETVADAVLPFEPVFFEKGLTVISEIESGIKLKGDRTKLKQVVEILLDNAQKYCHEGTETKVMLARRGKTAVLSVSDYGDEMTNEQLKNCFKRFYRGDEARAMNQSYGLGLSIAQGIIETHKGKIWAESENGVNTFFVLLPC